MFTVSSQLNVTLICGLTDMRKAIDGKRPANHTF